MKTLTVRIAVEDHALLAALSKETGEPLPVIVGRAVRLLKAQEAMRQLDEDYVRLKTDSGAWQRVRREMEVYESTLVDGLEPEEWTEADFVSGDADDAGGG